MMGAYDLFRWPRNWKRHVQFARDRGYLLQEEYYTIPEKPQGKVWMIRRAVRKEVNCNQVEKLKRKLWFVCAPPLN